VPTADLFTVHGSVCLRVPSQHREMEQTNDTYPKKLHFFNIASNNSN
jgi:hypothetical protein